MSVLHPSMALAAIAAVAVPILIHLLLRRRRRVVQWAAMLLLQRAVRRDRRRQRIERWMLLAARCLLVALGGLALAQPFVGSDGAPLTRLRTLWLVVDDGIASAERLPDGETSLGRSVAEARRLVASLGASDRVGLVTAAAPVRRLVDPPTADKERVDMLLSTLQPAYTGSDIAGAISEAMAAASVEGPAELILLSGLRVGSLDPGSEPPAFDAVVARRVSRSSLPPLSGASPNAWISGVEFLRGGDEGIAAGDRALRVRIERRAADLPRTTRRVTAVGSDRGAVDAVLDAGERRTGAELRLRRGTPGENGGEISISIDEDAQPRDDRIYAVLPQERVLRVIVLDRRGISARQDLERLSPGAWMARALAPARGVGMQVEELDPGSLDRSIIQGVDAVIVARPDLISPEGWSILRGLADLGGVLVVSPAPDDAGQRWVERFRSALAPAWRIEPEVEAAETAWRLAPQQPSSSTLRMLGSEISLLAAPISAQRRLRMAAPAADAEAPLLFEDEHPLLLAGRPSGMSRGWIVALAVAPDLSWTDLPVRPLMVPLMQEVVRQGRTLASAEERRTVGTRVPLPRGAAVLSRRTDEGRDDSVRGAITLAVGDDGRTREPVLLPGLYDALDERGRRVGVVAVNIDPARASIEANDPAAVRAWLERMGPWTWIGETTDSEAAVERLPDEGVWSRVLLMVALALALGEAVLARLLSRGDPLRGAT